MSRTTALPPGPAPWRNTARVLLSASLLLALAALLAWLPLRWAALLVAATAGGLALLRWPWLAWAGLAAALPFAAALKVGPASGADLIVLAAAALWFADGARRRTLALRSPPPLVPALLYAALLGLSALAAADLREAALEVVKWVEFAAVLALAASSLQARGVQWLAAGALAGAAGQALLGLYQFIYQVGPDWFIILGRFMRASGSFAQPNPYAGYLGLVLPVAASLALHSLARAARHPTWSTFATTASFSGATLLIAAGLAASWSRGGWLGAAAGLALVLALRSRAALAASAAGALAAALAALLGSFNPALVPPPVAARLADLPAYLGLSDVLSQPVTDENFAVVERIAHWVAAQRMWEMAPWLGVGPGNYAAVYPLVRLPRWEEALGHAHNIYLNTLAESGLLGFAAFLLLWGVAFVWTARRALAGRPGSYSRALALGVLGALAHLAVHNFFDNLFVQSIPLLLALWLAAVDAVDDAEPAG